MLFSIVITTYGRSEKIKRSLFSVLNQTYKKEYEIIVVDDNGKGTLNQYRTERIIEEFKGIKYLVLDKNMGANAARNKGILEAKGKYILLLDDDDEFLENKLEIFEQEIRKKEVDILYSEANFIDAKTNKIVFKTKLEEIENIKYEILKNNFIGSNSFVGLKKSKLLEVGLFDEQLKSCQDWEMWIRIIFNEGEISGIKERLVNYYIDSNEVTRITNNFNNKLQGHLSIIKKTKEKYLRIFLPKQIIEIQYSQLNKIKEICYESNALKEYRYYFIKNFNLKKYKVKEYIKFIFAIFNIKLTKKKIYFVKK